MYYDKNDNDMERSGCCWDDNAIGECRYTVSFPLVPFEKKLKLVTLFSVYTNR
jgi:hypothetical protein